MINILGDISVKPRIKLGDLGSYLSFVFIIVIVFDSYYLNNVPFTQKFIAFFPRAKNKEILLKHAINDFGLELLLKQSN